MSGRQAKAVETNYANAVFNTLEPVWGSQQIMGSAQYVAIETLVGQVVRRIMSLNTNWWDAIETHTFSLPVIGSMNFGEPMASVKAKPQVGALAVDGSKAIPGAIIGYIAHKIRQDGLRIPAFANRDFVALLIGKIVSRPIQGYLAQVLPKQFTASQAVLDALFNRQRETANMKVA